MRKKPCTKSLQAQVDSWNTAYPIGTTVAYSEIIGEPVTLTTKTRSEAQVLSGHSAVVWLEGKAGCVCIEHCKVLLASGQYFTHDGMLMNADGTRSIFDDVDK